MKISNRLLSFIIALFYVGGGTIMGAIYWTSTNSLDGIGGFINNFFLPVSFLMEGIIFAERNSFFPVLFCQTVILLMVWGIVHLILSVTRYKH
jgi:hypothetical protein